MENRQKVAVGGEVEAIIGGLDLIYVKLTLPLRSVGFRLPVRALEAFPTSRWLFSDHIGGVR